MIDKTNKPLDDSKVDKNIRTPHPALRLGYKTPQKFKSQAERIENAMRILAEIIANGEEEYLPLFLRLENELDRCRKRNAELERAIQFSQKEH